MEFEEKLQKIEAIGKLALSGKKDKELAKQFNTTRFYIMNVRRSLGIRHRTFKPITEVWRKISFTNGYHYVKFSLTNDIIEKMGYDSKKKLEVIGKISGTKLVLEFQEQ